MKFKILAIVAMVFTLASCSGKASPGGATKVSVVLDWLPNTNHTGMYIALAKGYYADEGLDVSIDQPPEDGALPLLASGKADFAVSTQEEIASALVSGLNVKAVAALLQHNTSGIISLAEKNILTPADMCGSNYATWDLPIEKAILRDCVESEGGDFSQVKMIPSTVTDVLAAISTNVDCIWIYYGWDGVAAEVKGLDTNYFEFRNFVPELDFYTPLLASSGTFLENSPETAAAFLRATAKGYEYAIAHPEDAADIFLSYSPETDVEIAKKSQLYLSGQYKAEVSQWGYISPERWNGFFNWLTDKEIIQESLENKGFTNEFLSKQQ